jgi:hypothetical protein
MYKYGESVRRKCKYAAEATEMMRQMQRQQAATDSPDSVVEDETSLE